MIFHVYQGYALSLLGRHQEAIQVLEHVAEHRKLVKNASALLIWSAALPSGDPRQEWVAEKLTALKPKMRAKQRALVDRVMNQRRSFALMQAAPPQLEPLLQQDLERAESLREVESRSSLATRAVGKRVSSSSSIFWVPIPVWRIAPPHWGQTSCSGWV